MNKQRFLTELRRLLIFMTDSDRELTINRYAAMFDEAGEEDEEFLLEELGSPTKLAISLSRGYEPGRLTTEVRQRQALKKAEDAAKAAKAASLSADDYEPGRLEPEYEEENDPIAIIMRSLEEPDEPFEVKKPAVRPVYEDEDDGYDDDDYEDYDEPREPHYERIDAPMGRGAGIAVLTLVLLVLGVPLALLTLCVALVWLLPGLALFGGALLFAIGALWCIGVLADALLTFGTAFVLLALGILLLWCGIWLDVRLIGLYVRGVRWLSDKLLGKKVLV